MLNHILGVLNVAATGAEKADHISASTIRGVSNALSREADNIIKTVLEKL